jgi:Mn2+/Fe2+ NRAMP family transporter
MLVLSSRETTVDLQAGSHIGYWLSFVVLLAGVFAVFLQVND